MYSTQVVAWEAFRVKVGRAPYSLGRFIYKTRETFILALTENIHTTNAILIYTDVNFAVQIEWNVLDKPLP